MKNYLKTLITLQIIVSYSDDGLLTKEKIIEILEKNCNNKAKVYEIDYNRYKSKIASLKNNDHKEYLFYIRNNKGDNNNKIEQPKKQVELGKITKKKDFIKRKS